MKKLLITLIMLFAVLSCIGASTTSPSSTLKEAVNNKPTIKVNFFYDSELMQRMTFGFTDSTSLHWIGDNGDLKNGSLQLDTQFANDFSGEARGFGSVNFYWILRTNKAVSAKLYLVSPMTEMQSDTSLDWSIVFDSKKDNIVSHNNSINSVYGESNAVEIFSKSAASEISTDMSYLPIEVYTDYTVVPDKDKHYYSGNVGVLVETN